ncbi:MAG: chromosome segregation protein SMC [Bacteroidetes bacterium]|nr:chromosome segregation protein SMC [Bacteroidota bacterium]
MFALPYRKTMKLKTIEIKGFKSFGDKVALQFIDGVTGIVGPNGCGKSNVVDALRWVLGEQKTRMLRSEKMENVIFNGTKKRRQASMAEVHICFENTSGLLPVEYREVTISRRLYRTGESEYMLNGVNCRLRDIATLLMNTGVGSDSYAIMELRMIEDILSDKDNSRRLLFEEAAGISRYKARKKESLVKLQETEQDLSRVDDLVHEIEKNLKALQAQARRAEKYVRMKEEYRTQALRLASTQMSSLGSDLNRQESECQQLSHQQVELDAQIATSEAASQEFKNKLIRQEQELRALQTQVRAYLDETRALEQAKQLGGEKLSSLRRQEQLVSERLSSDQTALNELIRTQSDEREQIENQTIQAAQLLERKNNCATQLSEKQAETDACIRQLQTKNQELQNLTSRIHAQERQQAVESGKQESARQELLRIQVETKKAEVEWDSAQAVLKENEQQRSEAHAFWHVLKEQVGQSTQQKAQFVQQRDDLRRDLDQMIRETDKLRNELQLTRSMIESMEGYPESHKYLRDHGRFGSTPVVVADLMQADPEWKPVLESFLEPYLNHYWVQTADEAQEAVFLLSDSSKGRVGFFINDTLIQSKSQEAVLPEGCVAALSLIRCREEHKALFQYLLQGVLVCDEHALKRLGPEVLSGQSKWVLLGKNGVLTIGKNWISGGSIGLFQGKRIGRVLRMEELNKAIAKSEKAIDRQQSALAKLESKIIELNQEIEAVPLDFQQAKCTELDRVGNQIRQQIALAEAALTRNRGRISELESFLDTSVNQSETTAPDLGAMRTEHEKIQKEIHQLQPFAESLRVELEPLRRQFHELSLAWQQSVSRLESQQQSAHQRQQQIERLEHRHVQDREQLLGIRTEAEQWQNQQGPNDEELAERYRQQSEWNTRQGQAEDNFLSARNLLTQQEEDIRVMRQRRDQVLQLFQLAQNRLNELRIRETSIRERLRAEFEMELDALEDTAPMDAQQLLGLEQNLAGLRSRLADFGPINPMALETYKEVEERNQFIAQQRMDLLEARGSLLETIEEIDQTARERFLEAFELIRTHFIEVFRTLFSDEDACDLQLVDPQQPLDSPIHIVARPKGKKPLSINQLSGGEKSLTATALLFAIFLYKPAPFCIFDEVDAPLDDNNIDKFNRMIKQFSRQSQFVIVTHNKKTMETTDIMYGITMVEQGVSRVVPVDFRSLSPN